jgi:cytochrome c
MSTMRSAFRMSAGLAIAAVAALSFGAFAADPVMNPVTKAVEPKQMYCERLDETAVCGGIYQ